MRYAEDRQQAAGVVLPRLTGGWYSWRHQLGGERGGLSLRGARHARLWRQRGTRADRPIHAVAHGRRHGRAHQALGESKAVIVGHDWGAVAWHAALWRPDLFPAVCAMSVPYALPGYVDVLTALEKLGINDFYLQYFQKPGVPEAELQADIGGALRRIYFTAGGKRGKGQALPPDRRHVARQHRRSPGAAGVVERGRPRLHAEFARTGFRGRLNWYRNLRRNWELGGPWRGQPIRQPSLFIAGSRDGVLRFPAAQSQLDAFPKPCWGWSAATSSRAPAIGCSRSGRPRSTNCGSTS
jgi:pimeloyl-ACP methyl ester carboxylesterase